MAGNRRAAEDAELKYKSKPSQRSPRLCGSKKKPHSRIEVRL